MWRVWHVMMAGAIVFLGVGGWVRVWVWVMVGVWVVHYRHCHCAAAR